jgi:hypothetical protein
MLFVDIVLPFLIVFLAGVGLGTFVVGSLIRSIAAETKTAVLTEFTDVKDRLESVAKSFEERAAAIKKAL